jgi:hypothetical protein
MRRKSKGVNVRIQKMKNNLLGGDEREGEGEGGGCPGEA